MDKPKTKPVKTFRAKNVSISIFMNEHEKDGKTFKLPSFCLQKRYRDGDEWKTSASLFLEDLPKAVNVINKAYDYIVSGEVKVDKVEEEQAPPF